MKWEMMKKMFYKIRIEAKNDNQIIQTFNKWQHDWVIKEERQKEEKEEQSCAV